MNRDEALRFIGRKDGSMGVTVRWFDGQKNPSLCIEENGMVKKLASFRNPASVDELEEFVRRMMKR